MKREAGTGVRLVVVLLALLMVVVTVWQGLQWRDREEEDDRRAAAVQVAQDQVLDLTTIDSDTIDGKLKSMRARTTGEFSRQLEGVVEAFTAAVDKAKLSASGTIDGAAVAAYDGGSAEVLVAATAVVTNASEPQPTGRSYRMRLHLVWADGGWLIDGMEFVA